VVPRRKASRCLFDRRPCLLKSADLRLPKPGGQADPVPACADHRQHSVEPGVAGSMAYRGGRSRPVARPRSIASSARGATLTRVLDGPVARAGDLQAKHQHRTRARAAVHFPRCRPCARRRPLLRPKRKTNKRLRRHHRPGHGCTCALAPDSTARRLATGRSFPADRRPRAVAAPSRRRATAAWR
jgi:hypothetical protein